MTSVIRARGKGGYVDVVVDDDVYEVSSKHAWRLFGAGYVGRKVYSHSVDGKSFYRLVYIHRLITGAVDGQQVDHIDHDKLNNQRSNLRVCTSSQNMQNRGGQSTKGGRPTSSQFKGVRRAHPSAGMKSRPWQAEIGANGRARSLGYYPTEHEAAAAYDSAAIELHGNFACINGVAAP